MRIKNIRLAMSMVELVTPFKTALRSVEHIEDVIVMIETHCGHVGYGSAPATPQITGDTHASIIAAITHIYQPRLIGQYLNDFEYLLGVIHQSMINNTSAKAALEIALYDLLAQSKHLPLYQLLGGNSNRLVTDITISVDAIDKMLHDTQLALDQGYDVLKIKVGNELAKDIERIVAIDDLVANRALLRLDVNQGWQAKAAVTAITQLEQQGIVLELVEQPVAYDDIKGLEYVTKHTQTPIMADESAFSPTQVKQLLRCQAADIINIKLMKTGGISRALEIAQMSYKQQTPCMIGCMLEGSVAVSAAAHVAAAVPEQISKIDLDGPSLGQFDPVIGGTRFNGPSIELNSSPGLGIESIKGLSYL